MNEGLVKKTGLYLIGNLSSKLVSVLLIPLYAFFVSAEDLGNYDYYQTIMLMVVPFMFVAIWESILKFLLKNEEKKESIISTTIIFVIAICTVIIAISYISVSIFRIKIDDFSLIIIMIISYSLACIWQYYSRGLKQNNIYVIGSITGTLINFGMNIILLCIFNMGITSLYISYIISQISIFMIIEFNLKCFKRVRIKYFDFKLLKEMLKFSSPLVLNLVSMWFISGFGRTLINKTLGAEAQGIYAFANKFGVVINVLGSVISMALIEEAVIKSKDEGLREYFSETIQKLFMMFQSIILIASPAIVIFYNIINETPYYSSINVFAYFLIYAMFMTMATNIGAIFQAIEKTKYIFFTTILGAITTIILSVYLIEILGIIGVAIGQISGAIVMLVSRYMICNHYLKLKINFRIIIIMLLIYIISSFISVKGGIIGSCIMILLNLVFIVIFNKKDLKNIYLFFLKIINKRG